MTAICIERRTFDLEELELAGGQTKSMKYEQLLDVGETVRVKAEDSRIRCRKPHLRTPGYLFGAVGVVEKFLGYFSNPEEKAFYTDKEPELQPLYLVAFRSKDLWSGVEVHGQDVVTAEVYQPWLDSVNTEIKRQTEENIHMMPWSKLL